MQLPLNPEDLAVESVVIGPELDESQAESQLWYTNTQPVPRSNTGCASCWA
jgi:hypothetical protein